MYPDVATRPWRNAFAVLVIAGVMFCFVSCAAQSEQLDRARAGNRSKLVQLQRGMGRSDVLDLMGTEPVQVRDAWAVVQTINNPYRTEMYVAVGHNIEVLYYYTDLKAADNAITDDELTPLVLRDGQLDGWGWSYLTDVAAKYEIRLR